MDNLTTRPGYRALRKGRCSIPGQAYLVTTICSNRTPWFAEWRHASVLCAAFTEPKLWKTSRLQCWVLMPDHLHFLVELGSEESLPRLVQRIKAITARTLNITACRPGSRLWMPGYHDRALRQDEDAREAARYIIANPLRAGLAASVAEYPYWDAIWVDGVAALP